VQSKRGNSEKKIWILREDRERDRPCGLLDILTRGWVHKREVLDSKPHNFK
jgi:hypothetical protein